jgi:hypothetical protein
MSALGTTHQHMGFFFLSHYNRKAQTKNINLQFVKTFLELKNNKTSCFKQIDFITEDTKIKHTNITTIYKDN